MAEQFTAEEVKMLYAGIGKKAPKPLKASTSKKTCTDCKTTQGTLKTNESESVVFRKNGKLTTVEVQVADDGKLVLPCPFSSIF